MKPDRTVVITGGNGFVGRHLLNELGEFWPQAQLVVWDKSVDDLPAGVLGVEVDITKPETYIDSLKEHKPAWVVHLAAIAAVSTALKNKDLIRNVNTEASEELLEEISKHSDNTQVLAISSAEIYGIEYSEPLAELPLDQARPRNPYAESKLLMEKMIEEKYNDFVIRVRPFPHIGPGQDLGFVTADFASQIAAAEKSNQEPVIKVGNLNKGRDFTDVRDVVRAYRLLMEEGKIGEVYHVASEKSVLVSDILEKLIAMAAVKVSVVKDETRVRAVDLSILVGSAKKLREETGWSAKIPLDQSLQDILNWWRK